MIKFGDSLSNTLEKNLKTIPPEITHLNFTPKLNEQRGNMARYR